MPHPQRSCPPGQRPPQPWKGAHPNLNALPRRDRQSARQPEAEDNAPLHPPGHQDLLYSHHGLLYNHLGHPYNRHGLLYNHLGRPCCRQDLLLCHLAHPYGLHIHLYIRLDRLYIHNQGRLLL